ncbi:peptide/nickel transport system permease protein [Actinomadura pelletieri DSM 43383]|uniref:Peptide/nickel transport system permease protein n=1 Tax=Actinomadura pelletieri DSM 43383 TaxID=1120940 RepID=A0A495QY61_9ACTN|nr:ABC transporter permease [Actinomadura pelletieri]RKS78964.1 peptide/nickel transport system permease protein [Actinomadura pelletieri DSM 43383]
MAIETTTENAVKAAPTPDRSRRTALAWLIGRRALMGLVTLWCISVIVFVATQTMPGDVAKIILGPSATADQVDQLNKNLGLDQPLFSQYWDWLRNVLTGDMGNSLVSGQPVSELLSERIFNSATLTVMAMVLILPLSLLVGLLAAVFRDKFLDRSYLGTSLIVTATPDFVLGSLVVAVFGTVVFKVLPPVSLIPPGDVPWQHPKELVMPLAVMVLVGVTYLSRLVRVSFIDVMESEYVQLAMLKGLSMRRVLFRHALPNALAPSIPAASIMAAYTIAGSVVIEYLFAYPGIGSALVDAVAGHDLPMIQAIIMLMAAAFFCFNQLADVLGTLNKSR